MEVYVSTVAEIGPAKQDLCTATKKAIGILI